MKRKDYAHPARRRAKEIRDLWSLLNWRDLCYQAGSYLYGKSYKYTAIVAAASVGSLFGKALSQRLGLSLFENYTTQQAITTPLFFGAIMLASGLILMTLPVLITSRRHLIAHANDLNLMEDYKKSLQSRHLDALWEQVFRYESALLFTDEERARERAMIEERRARYRALEREFQSADRAPASSPDTLERIIDEMLALRPWSDLLETTRDGFLISARYVLRHHFSQMAEAASVGFSLSLLEDWYDEHPFPTGYGKIVEQYWGNIVLRQIEEAVGYTRRESTTHTVKLSLQCQWASLVARAVTTNVGAYIPYLNKRYGTNLFNSQVLLWPGEEDRPEITQLTAPVNSAAHLGGNLLRGLGRRAVRRPIARPHLNAREEVRRLRRNLFHNIFGETLHDAHEMIDRMCLTSFELAGDLRARLDPEYATGALAETFVADFKAEGFSRIYVRRAKRLARRSRRALKTFLAALRASERFAPLFAFEHAEALRAVTIAFHTNRHDLRARFRREGLEACAETIAAAVADAKLFSTRLRAVRIHHVLTKLELALYRDLVRALAYAPQVIEEPVATHALPAVPTVSGL